GRYSFLGSGPFLRFQAHDRRVRIEQSVERGARSAERKQGTALRAPRSALNDTIEEMDHPDPLRLLEERLASYRAPHLPGLPRFCGGAVGYAGYDTVRYVERLPNPPPDDRSLPDLCFALYDRMVIFDHINKTIAVVAHAHVPKSGSSKDELMRSYQEACLRVDRMAERLQQGVADLQLTDITPAGEVRRQAH